MFVELAQLKSAVIIIVLIIIFIWIRVEMVAYDVKVLERKLYDAFPEKSTSDNK